MHNKSFCNIIPIRDQLTDENTQCLCCLFKPTAIKRSGKKKKKVKFGIFYTFFRIQTYRNIFTVISETKLIFSFLLKSSAFKYLPYKSLLRKFKFDFFFISIVIRRRKKSIFKDIFSKWMLYLYFDLCWHCIHMVMNMKTAQHSTWALFLIREANCYHQHVLKKNAVVMNSFVCLLVSKKATQTENHPKWSFQQ